MGCFKNYINNRNLGINEIMHNLKYPDNKGEVDVYVYVNNEGLLSVNIGEPTFDIETTRYFHSRYKLTKEDYIDEQGSHQLDEVITNYYVDDLYETEEPMYLLGDDFIEGDEEWYD